MMSTTATRKRKPGRPAKARTGRMRKVSCPCCGFICYSSAGAMQRCGLPICACGSPLVIAHERDLAVVDPEAHEAAQVSGHREREARRALRDERESRHGFASHVNCGVCGRFKREPAEPCEYCGDEPMPVGEDPHAFNRAHGMPF